VLTIFGVTQIAWSDANCSLSLSASVSWLLRELRNDSLLM